MKDWNRRCNGGFRRKKKKSKTAEKKIFEEIMEVNFPEWKK